MFIQSLIEQSSQSSNNVVENGSIKNRTSLKTTTNTTLSSFMQSAVGIHHEIQNIEREIQSFISHLLREMEFSTNQDDMNEIYHDGIDRQLLESGDHLTLLKSIVDQSKYSPNQYHQQLHYKSIVQFLNHSLSHCKHLLSFTQTLKERRKRNLMRKNNTTSTLIDDVMGGGGGGGNNQDSSSPTDTIIQQELLKQISSSTDLQDAQDTEITAIHISELLTLFESKVEEQSEMINMFEHNIEEANDCMDKATEELRKLNHQDDERLPFPYSILPSYVSHFIKYFVSYLFIVLGLIIFMYDRIKL